MNYFSIRRAMRSIVVVACLFAAGTSQGLEVWLRTTNSTLTMPDGRSVTMWAFAQDSSATAQDGIPTVPGPALNLLPGDTTLTIHLNNQLPEPVSIVIPGQFNYDNLTPAFHTSGPYANRVRSFTREAAAGGGTATYTWSSVQPGTYLYHSGSHPAVQVQMGLYGALTAVGSYKHVYMNIPYDFEATLLFSEIDPKVHDAVSGTNYGAGPQFFTSDFTNVEAFITALSSSSGPASVFLWGQFAQFSTSPPLSDQDYLLGPASPADKVQVLVADLNALLIGPSLYDPTIFPDAILSSTTKAQLASAPADNYPESGAPFRVELVRLNRLLLQDGLAADNNPLAALKAMTSTIRSYPKYFLINGQPYTNGIPTILAGAVGRNVLLRLLNASLNMRVPMVNNAGDMQVIAEDGQPAPFGRFTSGVLMPALKTVDVLWTPPHSGPTAIYDRRFGVVNAAQPDGGMLRYLSPAPLSVNVNPGTNGVIQIIGYTDPGAVFAIQSTLSLSPPIQWTPVAQLTNVTGTLTYYVTNNPAVQAIFYRALLVP